MFGATRSRFAAFEQLEDRVLLAADVQIQLRMVADGLSAPVVATHAGDGSGRMFVAEQDGTIQILLNELIQPTPFLNMGSGGLRQVVTGGERGLLGLAFHPDYATPDAAGEGRFYVYYSATRTAGGDHDSVVSEFRVSGNPNAADVDSERELLRFMQPASNHNGGDLQFGPDDGLLYISTGDGGFGGDPANNAQNRANLLGKILRIDVNGTNAPNGQYGIPSSNPFVGQPGIREEIYAYGLRNPFRMSFDDGPTPETVDRLFAGDVGQARWEEVDLITSGGNYGWRIREGAHPFNTTDPNPGNLIDPIAEYRNDATTASVIGGFVYRGEQYPALYGRYVFGDLRGPMFLLDEVDGQFQLSDLEVIDGDPADIIAFGQDEEGELYVLTFSSILAIETRITSIHGRVFHDMDASGEFDEGDQYLNDRTIELIDDRGDVVAVQQTHEIDFDLDEAIDPATERGWYWFNVAPGSYSVREVSVSGWRQTAPISELRQLAFDLDQQLDFFVSGSLFEDWGGLEERWLRSAREAGQWFYILPSGELFRWDDISGLPLGRPLNGDLVGTLDENYFTAPDRLVDVPPPSGTHEVTLSDGQLAEDLDFGTVQLAALQGRVFQDTNADGQRNEGEGFLNGWTVELLDIAGDVIAVETTRDMDLDQSGSIDPLTESGWYRFEGLERGTYLVNHLVQPGWMRTTPEVPEESELAFQLDQQLDFFTDGNLWEGWGGQGEKWLQAASDDESWYFITPDGQLRAWDGISGLPVGRPLSGVLVATLDPSFHAVPAKLINVEVRTAALETGEQSSGIDFGAVQLLAPSRLQPQPAHRGLPENSDSGLGLLFSAGAAIESSHHRVSIQPARHRDQPESPTADAGRWEISHPNPNVTITREAPVTAWDEAWSSEPILSEDEHLPDFIDSLTEHLRWSADADGSPAIGEPRP